MLRSETREATDHDAIAPSFARRRLGRTPAIETALNIGNLRIDPEAMRAFVGVQKLQLTVQEFDLLLLMVQAAGGPVSQEELSLRLWNDASPRRYRHLSVLVARLRSKIAGSKPYELRTMRKRGYGLMLPPVNRIEEIKYTRDGLDVLEDMLRYARTGAEIGPDDIERMKWYGVFYRRQTPGFFMLRLRVPNGILTSHQAAEIGRLSCRYGRGKIDITTRQNIQLRWLRIQDVPEVLEALTRAGLEYRQSGMDNVRNIIGCPMAGLDQDEMLDASPIARALQNAIVGKREFSNLPRKFNVSVSGCRHDCVTAQIHDLSLTAALKDGRPGFNVLVGGAGGPEPDFARDLDVFVPPDDALAFCLAVIEFFRDHGNRVDRQSGRLRRLRDERGLRRLRDELQSRFGPLERAGASQISRFAGDHLGVSPQRQAGLNTVGCSVPVGRIEGDELIEFGRLAATYGNGELRLTNNQNILVVNVPRDSLTGLLGEGLLRKYSPEPSAWMRRTVSCTGKDFCHFSLIDTKNSAVKFAQRMDELLPMESPVRVHWSGCARGCGQHYIGEIGFQAATVRAGDDFIEAADVYMGGSVGEEPRMATKVLDAVPLDELADRVAALMAPNGTDHATTAFKAPETQS